jgi:hypothetical protein
VQQITITLGQAVYDALLAKAGGNDERLDLK